MKADINLVVMIPAFNEEKTIGKVVSSIPRDCAKTVKVLVVNDGSKDNTVIEAKKAGADIIKFQTYKAKKLTVKASPRFWNWEGERDDKGSQYDSYSILDSFGKELYADFICSM